MASINEIEKEIAKLEKEKAKFDNAEYLGADRYKVGNLRLSTSQLRAEQDRLSNAIGDLRDAYAPYTDAEKNLRLAEEQLRLATEASRNKETLAQGNISQKQITDQIKTLGDEVRRLTQERDSAKRASYTLPGQPQFRPSVEVSAGMRVMGGTAARRGEQPAAGETGGTTTGTGTGGTGGTGAGGTGDGTGRVPLTPEERKQRKQDRADARFEKAAKQLRQMAPQMAWILDIDATKYPDVRALLSRAVKDRMFESPEGIQRFTNELNGTTFFTELRDKGTKQKIVGIVGDLGFDENNMGRLLKDAVNLQWDDDTLALESYKEAFRKNADGTYVHANAEARARKSNAYLSVQNIGTAYFNQLDDATVEMVLTGGMTSEDVQRQQRELAKSKYGHLSNLIDQGLSMDAITKSYQDEAARLLEVDPNSIAMGDAKYQTAYDFVDESGQKRLMTTGEWVRKLRTDSQYGWDKTENAKQEARQLASSIVQSFGRVS